MLVLENCIPSLKNLALKLYVPGVGLIKFVCRVNET